MKPRSMAVALDTFGVMISGIGVGLQLYFNAPPVLLALTAAAFGFCVGMLTWAITVYATRQEIQTP